MLQLISRSQSFRVRRIPRHILMVLLASPALCIAGPDRR
jgi:hypothetical protein